jgi:hypothetical protein
MGLGSHYWQLVLLSKSAQYLLLESVCITMFQGLAAAGGDHNILRCTRSDDLISIMLYSL